MKRSCFYQRRGREIATGFRTHFTSPVEVAKQRLHNIRSNLKWWGRLNRRLQLIRAYVDAGWMDVRLGLWAAPYLRIVLPSISVFTLDKTPIDKGSLRRCWSPDWPKYARRAHTGDIPFGNRFVAIPEKSEKSAFEWFTVVERADDDPL